METCSDEQMKKPTPTAANLICVQKFDLICAVPKIRKFKTACMQPRHMLNLTRISNVCVRRGVELRIYAC